MIRHCQYQTYFGAVLSAQVARSGLEYLGHANTGVEVHQHFHASSSGGSFFRSGRRGIVVSGRKMFNFGLGRGDVRIGGVRIELSGVGRHGENGEVVVGGGGVCEGCEVQENVCVCLGAKYEQRDRGEKVVFRKT